jgi:hypothetical protein
LHVKHWVADGPEHVAHVDEHTTAAEAVAVTVAPFVFVVAAVATVVVDAVVVVAVVVELELDELLEISAFKFPDDQVQLFGSYSVA